MQSSDFRTYPFKTFQLCAAKRILKKQAIALICLLSLSITFIRFSLFLFLFLPFLMPRFLLQIGNRFVFFSALLLRKASPFGVSFRKVDFVSTCCHFFGRRKNCKAERAYCMLHLRIIVYFDIAGTAKNLAWQLQSQ